MIMKTWYLVMLGKNRWLNYKMLSSITVDTELTKTIARMLRKYTEFTPYKYRMLRAILQVLDYRTGSYSLSKKPIPMDG